MSIHTLDVIYTTLLYLCAVGQAVFVGVWLTVKWYETWVGRALMFKSASLFITLTSVSLFRLTHAHFTPETFYKVYILLFTGMFLGIISQDIAILRELWLKKKVGNIHDTVSIEKGTSISLERDPGNSASSD